MFLSDRTIKQLVRDNILIIDPFDERLVQPASYDLTLGDVDMERPMTFDSTIWSIEPGQFVLATTVERVYLPSHVAGTVMGKSTWGRKGLTVHQTAGWVDPGFPGQLTLEMFNCSSKSVIMRKGTPICQIVFGFLDVPAEHPYSGRYMYQSGITPPRASVEYQAAMMNAREYRVDTNE